MTEMEEPAEFHADQVLDQRMAAADLSYIDRNVNNLLSQSLSYSGSVTFTSCTRDSKQSVREAFTNAANRKVPWSLGTTCGQV